MLTPAPYRGIEKPVMFPYKRPAVLNGHLILRDFTATSCQKGSYLHINIHIIEKIKNNGIGKQHYNPLIQ